MGPTIRKDPGAADLAATRKREGTRGRTRERAGVETHLGRSEIVGQRRNRREPKRTGARMGNSGLNLTTTGDVWTARTSVFDRAALSNTRGEGKTGAVGESICHLPTADDQVHGTARAAHEFFASAHWQLVDRVAHKDLIAIVLVWTPRKFFVHGKIIVVVGESVGEGVVREELETSADALFGLNLQSVVFVVGVVPIIAGIDRAARRCGMYYAQG